MQTSSLHPVTPVSTHAVARIPPRHPGNLHCKQGASLAAVPTLARVLATSALDHQVDVDQKVTQKEFQFPKKHNMQARIRSISRAVGASLSPSLSPSPSLSHSHAHSLPLS